MPTGVHLRDVREQLFNAAERVLLRDGAHALTSRAITTEANCAKGVLHRHFADFDAFLTELVLDRITRLDAHAARLCETAGTGTVTDNLSAMLEELFDSVAIAIVGLVTVRDPLRDRLREARSTNGIPLLTEASTAIATYLSTERELGRITPEADINTLAPTLIGATHLLFTDAQGTPPKQSLHKTITTVLATALPSGGR